MDFYDNIAPVYDTLFTDEASAAENEAIAAKILPLCSGRILDVGCGTGLIHELVPFIMPANYVGIDPSQKMLDRFSLKHPEFRPCLRKATLGQYLQGISLSNPPRFGAVIGLFGVGSYLRPLDLERLPMLMAPDSRYFLMFYAPDYFPATYEKTGFKTENFFGRHMTPNVLRRLIRNGCRVEEFNNYLIATNA